MDSSFAAKNKILKRMPGITYYPLYHVLRFSIKMNLSPVLVKLLTASFKTTNSFYCKNQFLQLQTFFQKV